MSKLLAFLHLSQSDAWAVYDIQVISLDAQTMLQGLVGEQGLPQEVERVQAAVVTVQKCIAHHQGSLVQFRCDEKGFLSICAFGLPGKSHEDGPSRAVQAALSITAAMHKLGQVTQDSQLCFSQKILDFSI